MQKAAQIALSKNKELVPAATPLKALKPGQKYIQKGIATNLLVFEEGYDFENPKKLVQQIFPKNFHFIPEDLRKTQKFYEFLLVDSDSCEFKH